VTPHCLTEGLVGPHELSLLALVRAAVDGLPDGLDCHQVCARVVESARGRLRHVRGRFHGWDHSWLEVTGTRCVIDPYPWACAGGPLLVDCRTGSPWATLCREVTPETPP
jgi:hypothetical protein